jgi:hypothetical protein
MTGVYLYHVCTGGIDHGAEGNPVEGIAGTCFHGLVLHKRGLYWRSGLLGKSTNETSGNNYQKEKNSTHDVTLGGDFHMKIQHSCKVLGNLDYI